MTKDYPWGKGTPKWTRDATTNDSDKSFTVPAGKVWDMSAVYLSMTATATVGNRIMTVVVSPDGANPLILFQSGALVASATGHYLVGFGNFSPDDGANRFTLAQGMPRTILTAGAVVRVYDIAAIDAAADDLTVVLHYVEYDI